MGCSNSTDVIVSSQAEVAKGTGKVTLDYFALHGRAIGTRFVLYYCGVDFVDTEVSVPMGFVKRKVCGPLKYGTLPKLILENGTTLHQSQSITRYIGNRFRGANGETLYPGTD